MSCACTACQELLTLDPWKRVFYAQGLVLGVDEFAQEELRFLEGERRQNRALHGYGTVCGLEVRVRDSGSGPEVYVAPGLAIDPKGRWIHVPEARCALLNRWLREHPEAPGSPPVGSPPGTVSLSLRLCYRECETDLLPIPGGPCRTADESMTASRVAESFALDLTPEAPDQTEVEAVREFARLLGRLRVVAGGTAGLTVAQLEAMVRALAPAASPPEGSPPESPPASPPGSPEAPLDVPEAEIGAYLDAAFRVWVAEVRPALLPPGQGCAVGVPAEGCILLARLSFPTVPGGAGPVVDGDREAVEVDEAGRPYLLHTQLLQELIANGVGSGGVAGATVHGDLLGLEQDDHRQYLMVADRSGPATEDVLVRNLSGDATFRITGLPEAGAQGEAMPHGQTAGGDLDGNYPDPRVVGLQGLGVPQPAVADSGRFLRVAGTSESNLRWELAPAPSAGGGDTEEGLVRIFALSWRHNQPHDFRFDLRDHPVLGDRIVRGIALAFGREEVGDAGVRVGIERRDETLLLDLGSLDSSSIKLFVELPDREINGVRRVRLLPTDIVPIRPDATPGVPVFSSGTAIERREAPAALLIFPEEVLAELTDARYEIEVLGDHILDAGDPPRAIDAEFLRSVLPSGDRPDQVPRGIQGGQLMSWVTARRRGPNRPIDINLATAGELIARADVSERVAMNIVNRRNARRGGFRSLEELRRVPQIGNVTVRRIVESGAFTIGG